MRWLLNTRDKVGVQIAYLWFEKGGGGESSMAQQVEQYRINICSKENKYHHINNLRRHMTSPIKGRTVTKWLTYTHKQLEDVSLYIYDYTHK